MSTDAIATDTAVLTNRVIVAVDGSPSSLEALRVGHAMAELLGARLVGVTAWQPFRHGVLPPLSAHPEEFAEHLVANCLLAAFRNSAVPETEILAVEGDPADRLIDLSHQARLLVVGSRGHSGLSGVLLGSVSNTCAAHAACPVLVVHAAAPVPVPVPVQQRSTTDLTPDQRVVVTF
jgi:nucleotide-binding universal stress UspA family protein